MKIAIYCILLESSSKGQWWGTRMRIYCMSYNIFPYKCYTFDLWNYFQVICYKWLFADVMSKIISQMCLINLKKHDILTRFIMKTLLNEYWTILIWPINTDTHKLVSVLLDRIDIIQYSFNNLYISCPYAILRCPWCQIY